MKEQGANVIGTTHFFFDLDGTITKQELLPQIGKALGLEKEITALTDLTIQGEIPFESSLEQRVEILKKVPISDVQHICANTPLNDHIVDFITEHKNKCAIVTGNLDVWIKPITEKLGIPVYSSIANSSGNTLNGITSILRKRDIIMGHSAQTTVAIGDGFNDTEMIEAATIGIAFGGVHWPANNLFEYCNHAIFREDTLCQFLKQLL
ncbi:MAG: HAD family phosphatase [bacterium]|nr:HAD family phosphatase [bacterium]